MAYGRREKRQSVVKDEVDIAIVGAGPAGLYCAWRLLSDKKYQKKKVCLFDAAEHAGGRVLSVKLPEVPYVTELGAMRYLRGQILISSLVEKQLKLKTAAFEFETAGYCLRGQFLSAEKFRKPPGVGTQTYEVPYKVDTSEQWKSPIELIVLGIQRALRELQLQVTAEVLDSKELQILRRKLADLPKNRIINVYKEFSEKEWRVIKRYGCIRDEPLFKIGFWDLIQINLSDEAFNLAHDGSGYQSILGSELINFAAARRQS